MTKEQLKKYRTWKAELNDLKLDTKSETVQESVQRSMREHPYIFGHGHVEGVPNDKYDLLVRKSDLKAKIKEVDDFVKSIPDYNLKKAVMIYYINDIEDGEDKPTWEDVVDEIGNGYNSGKLKVNLGRYINNYNSF